MGLVQDENGQKMSKSRATRSIRSTRWPSTVRMPSAGISFNGAPWLPKRFSDKIRAGGPAQADGHANGTRMRSMCCTPTSTILTLTKYTLEYDKLSVMDKWILSKMHSMVKTVDENLAAYAIPGRRASIAEVLSHENYRR